METGKRNRTKISIKRALVGIISGLILLLWGALFLGCEDCYDCRVVAADDTPPDAPQGVYSVTGDEAVYLYWYESPEPDFNHYWVWRGTTAIEGPYNKLAKVYDNSYVDRGVANGTTYYYAITAVDNSGNESIYLSADDVMDTPRPDGSGVVVYDYQLAPEVSGFDFLNHMVRKFDHSLTDVYFEYDADWNAMYVWAATEDTDIQDFGYTENFDELGWAPSDGWSNVGWLEIIPGHSYYVWTLDNHFAKFRADDVSLRNKTVTISWAYQTVPGNPELAPVRPDHVEGYGTRQVFIAAADVK
jgi:hypothetical protein